MIEPKEKLQFNQEIIDLPKSATEGYGAVQKKLKENAWGYIKSRDKLNYIFLHGDIANLEIKSHLNNFKSKPSVIKSRDKLLEDSWEEVEIYERIENEDGIIHLRPISSKI